MRCLLSIFMFALAFCTAMAQDQVTFTLLPDGTLSASDSTNYAIVEYPGLPAQEIYQLLVLNSGLNQPAGIPGQVLKMNNLKVTGPKMFKTWRRDYLSSFGFATLEFQIKDGKVKVLPPKMDDFLQWIGLGEKDTYPEVVERWFVQEQQTRKTNNNVDLSPFINNINRYINKVLGPKYEPQEDW